MTDSNPTHNEQRAAEKPGIVRRLYNWMLSWAESPWAGWAMFLFAMAEAVIFPIPPDVLLLALCVGMPKKSFRYALICTAGSVVGAMIGFGLGAFAWSAVEGLFIPGVFSQAAFDNVGNLYEQWNFWLVFTAGFTPLPYKLITISAGVFLGIHSFPIFVLASIISRGMRFCLVAGLVWKFGAPIKKFIDKYFNLCAIAFTLLLVGGFLVIKYAF